MNVLILGSGGREHAIAWKLAQSPLLNNLFIAPGNAGTLQAGRNVNLGVADFEAISKFTIDNKIDMLVVGPENPLVDGISDYFNQNDQLSDILVVGPVKAGALLEGSKDFAKRFMQKYSIPTADYKTFTKENLGEAKSFLESINPPYVLKADGLAAGKGVIILNDLDEAYSTLVEMFSGKFGEAGKTVVIEKFLDGIELSVFVLTDGDSYVILPEAKDYKRIGEGDTGLNTGGMGAVSPVPFADKEFIHKVESRIIKPTIDGLKNEEIIYKGFIFFGLIKVKDEPYVIEYNVRMGDPEAEVVIPRIKSDLLELFKAVCENSLGEKRLEVENRTVSTVMLVSGGYPGSYENGKQIKGLDKVENSIIFHAGTRKESGEIFTSGGRVLAVSSYGDNIEEALSQSYENANNIKFENMNFRKDIGFDL
ncbi:MAG: phosphoribosylamine--glycine ligase [Bacteroidales bacterium]|nr:phosphoribosylamine--glycine ligase [Bacteroidales bacterium]